MPTEILTRAGPTAALPPPSPEVAWTQAHRAIVRRLERHLAAYVVGIVALAPLWAFAEYETHGAFERFSSNGHAGDWKPWLLYAAIGWGLWVASLGFTAYFHRPTSEALRQVERVQRVKAYAATYLLALLVLTPVWLVSQYAEADGWPKHLSSRSRYPGDWDPWIIWVAVVGATLVGVAGLRAYRAGREAGVRREPERLDGEDGE